MKLSEIVDSSAYCSIGCITKVGDIDLLKSYLLYNFPVISKFPKIIVAVTKTDNISNEDLDRYVNVWLEVFGDKCIVKTTPNFGHTFGFTNLDKTVLKKAKELGFKYIWKATNDVLVEPQIFDVDMEDSNFLFFQGHGITGIESYYKSNTENAVNSFDERDYKYFFPQTNFFITTTDTDDLIDSETFDDLYDKYTSDPLYGKNYQIEYKYMLCECVLRDFVYRNKLKCKHLISKSSYKNLLDTIMLYKIADSSHKNIMFKECGVCHYHFYDQNIIEIL